MGTYNEELYREMMENEQEELASYYEEENCYAPVFNEILSNYE